MNDLNRKIVVGAAPLGQLDQFAAGFWRRFLGDEIQNFLLGDAEVQAIGALHEDIAPLDLHGVIIDLHRQLPADAARQHAAHVARGRVCGGDQSERELLRGIVVVGRELRDDSSLNENERQSPTCPMLISLLRNKATVSVVAIFPSSCSDMLRS